MLSDMTMRHNHEQHATYEWFGKEEKNMGMVSPFDNNTT